MDLGKVTSFADAIEAFNEGLIERCGGRWNGNLDAFNDYLSWPNEESVVKRTGFAPMGSIPEVS